METEEAAKGRAMKQLSVVRSSLARYVLPSFCFLPTVISSSALACGVAAAFVSPNSKFRDEADDVSCPLSYLARTFC